MRQMYMTLLVLVLAMASVAGAADQDPEKAPRCDEIGRGKLELTTADITILGITIGKTSLDEVQNELGPAKRSARNAICYVSSIDGTVLSVQTDWTGGFTLVAGFGLWSPESSYPDKQGCTFSRLFSRGLTTDSGIRLGLTIKNLEKIAGEKSQTTGATNPYEAFEYLCVQKMTDSEAKTADAGEFPFWFVSSSLHVWLTNSHASHIQIGKSITD